MNSLRPITTPRPPRGFTLVEAIATIAVLAVVMTVCSRIISTTVNAYAEIASAMERIGFEVRSCRLVSAGSAAPDMSAVRADRLTWTDSSGEARDLRVVGSALILTIGSTDYTLVNNVTAFAVSAFDESGAALAASLDDCSAVRRVQITITAARAGVAETLRSRLFLRRLAAGSASS